MKIVCLGDSLTKGFGIKPTEAWPALLGRESNIEVLNKGINGDTTGGMLVRLYRDAISNQPTHVLVMGGANDFIWDVPLTVVEANLAAMVHQVIHNLMMPVIGVPIPADVVAAHRHWAFNGDFGAVNAKLAAYRLWILRFAGYFRVPVVDFYQYFSSKKVRGRYFLDGVHPTIEGHEIMCSLAMAELGIAAEPGGRA